MALALFRNAAIVDGSSPEAQPGCDVLVEGNLIREVSDKAIAPGTADVIDLGGKALLPGLIDCHVHVTASLANLGHNANLPSSLIVAHAGHIMRGMLMRGFTSVRDAAGADLGLAMAVEQGLLLGPRLFLCGKALSQTGGHADFRGRFDGRLASWYLDKLGALGRVADGVSDLRLAVREEIKGGANFIKLMVNGGVSSPTDPIEFLGYSREEISAVVEEAGNAKTYVLGHLYTDEAIVRAVELGVHSVEHGNLVSDRGAKLMAQRGAFAVPTLVTYEALANEGAALGLSPVSVAKIDGVRRAGIGSLDIFRRNGVKMAFGSDLLGPMHRHQSAEFEIRGRVLAPHEVIASATSVAAELIQQSGKLGVIAPGAFADLIVVEGNPLKNLALLGGQGDHLTHIMKDGVFVKRP
jgi:imidazolonepropionase-like amidohydrolase